MRNSGKNFSRPDTPPLTPNSDVAIVSGFSPEAKNMKQGSGCDSDLSSAVPDLQISYASLFLGDKPTNNRHPRPSCVQPPTRTQKRTEEQRHRRKMVTPKNQGKTEIILATPCPSPSHQGRHSFCSASSSNLVGIKNVPPKLSHFCTGCEIKANGRSGVGEEEAKIYRKREGAKMLSGAKGVDASSASAGAGASAGRTRNDAANEADNYAYHVERGYDGDVEMDDVQSCGGSKAANIGGAPNGHAGDVEMGDVPPPHETNEGSSGSNESGSSDPPVKQTEEEEGNKIRKRVRWSEEVEIEETRRECERARKWRKSQSGSWPC